MNEYSVNELDSLLKELGCKSSSRDIEADHTCAVHQFLLKEKGIRHFNRIAKLMNSCGISKPQIRTFEQFNWSFNTAIPKEDILAFRNSDWITTPSNLILIGDPGIGKSHIAKALCYDAVQKAVSTYFISAYDLLNKINRAQYPETKINHLANRVKVLCIDELGYVMKKRDDTDILFQIISKRSEIAPTIITTNLKPSEWGTILSGPAASAILDRLNLNGYFLTWEGKSYRDRRKPN